MEFRLYELFGWCFLTVTEARYFYTHHVVRGHEQTRKPGVQNIRSKISFCITRKKYVKNETQKHSRVDNRTMHTKTKRHGRSTSTAVQQYSEYSALKPARKSLSLCQAVVWEVLQSESQPLSKGLPPSFSPVDSHPCGLRAERGACLSCG